MNTEVKNTYEVNPFVFMSTKIKQTDEKVFIQAMWSRRYGDNHISKDFDQLSNTIIDGDKYREYLKSEKWKEIKTQFKDKKGNKCNRCDSTDGIDIHHIRYDNLYNEKTEDLEALCHICHYREHI